MASLQELYESGLLTDEFVAKLVAKGNRQLFADAITANNLEVVKLFIKNGFDDSKNDYIGFSTALNTNNIEILKYFKEIGVLDAKIANPFLSSAASNGHLDLIKFLIESGCDVHFSDNIAIKNSSYHGHLEVVKFLIEHGADVKHKDNWSIKFASQNGHLEIVKLLIEHGADVKAENNYPINWSAYYDHLQVVKLLIEHGANPLIALNNRPSIRVKEYLLSLSNVSYYGIMVDKKLDIKLPELQEIVKNNKYYYVYKCQSVNTGYVVTDQINRYNILSQFGQVMYFNKI